MELCIDRLTKQYQNKIAVDRISLRLKPGVYGLLGANGAGKTTLMRMLCGILKPTSGTITFDGCDVSSEAYRAELGYLPQDFGYYPEFSGMDFLLYMASLKGLTKTEAKRKAVETYHIKPGEYKKNTYIQYQSEEHGEDEIIGTISFAGNPIPLIKYNVSPKTPSRKTPSAVVKKANSPVKFDRKKDVFVQQMGSGHIGIFKREDTGKIKELYGPSTPKITENEDVIQAVTDKVNEVLNRRIEHEIERLFNSEG